MNPGVSQRPCTWSSSFFLICYFSSSPLSHSITACLCLAHRQLRINEDTVSAIPTAVPHPSHPLQSISHGYELAINKYAAIKKFRRHLQGNNVKNNTIDIWQLNTHALQPSRRCFGIISITGSLESIFYFFVFFF